MAAYISVPRDLTRVKSKILFNLTKRQLICFSVAAIVGVPVFFLLKRTGNVSLATLGMMLVMEDENKNGCRTLTRKKWILAHDYRLSR